MSNDFVLSQGGKKIELYNNDIEDWTITFVDTGLNTTIGQRLVAIKPYLGDDDVFLANYADGLSDLDLNVYLDNFYQQDKIASCLCVQPSQSFHVVSVGNDSLIQSIAPAMDADLWINGGFFALKQEIFDYIQPGEELVAEPFQRLIDRKQLIGYRNPGFWACMDTLKEKIMFDEMYAKGQMPWTVWESLAKIDRNQQLLNGRHSDSSASELISKVK